MKPTNASPRAWSPLTLEIERRSMIARVTVRLAKTIAWRTMGRTLVLGGPGEVWIGATCGRSKDLGAVLMIMSDSCYAMFIFGVSMGQG